MKREDWQRVYVPRGDALDVRVRRTLRTLGDAPVRRMNMKKGIALALCAVLALASAVALAAGLLLTGGLRLLGDGGGNFTLLLAALWLLAGMLQRRFPKRKGQKSGRKLDFL